MFCIKEERFYCERISKSGKSKNIAEDHKDKYDDAINAMKKMSGLINYQITLIILKAAKLQKNPHRIQDE